MGLRRRPHGPRGRPNVLAAVLICMLPATAMSRMTPDVILETREAAHAAALDAATAAHLGQDGSAMEAAALPDDDGGAAFGYACPLHADGSSKCAGSDGDCVCASLSPPHNLDIDNTPLFVLVSFAARSGRVPAPVSALRGAYAHDSS